VRKSCDWEGAAGALTRRRTGSRRLPIVAVECGEEGGGGVLACGDRQCERDRNGKRAGREAGRGVTGYMGGKEEEQKDKKEGEEGTR